MATSGPNIAAVLQEKGGRLTTMDRPMPTPGLGEIVLRNRAVAMSRMDLKMQEEGLFVVKYPTVLGSEAAGEVVAVGADVIHFSVGDRAAGFSGIISNGNIDHGTWQTYVVMRESAMFKLPQSVPFEHAAVLPLGMATAAIGLFVNLKIPQEPHPPHSKEALLVWGATSSVGASAVQIAHSFGWKVFATASPKHHAWIKELGATAVFDYNNPNAVQDIATAVKAHGLFVRRAFDVISEGATLDLVPAALMASGGHDGINAIVGFWPKGKPQPEDVNTVLTVVMRHATDQTKFGRWFFNEWLEKGLAEGTVKCAPEPDIVNGGIPEAQQVFNMLKAGVSGKKLVMRVD